MSRTKLNAQMRRVIEVSNELLTHKSTSGSTGEIIAAAFILNDMTYLPASYTNVVDAWQRLGDWQEYVHIIREAHMHLIQLKA
jgi:hypothetical protein